MLDKKYFIGAIFGFVISMMFVPLESDAAIPPTPAWKTITVMTSNWFASDTDVVSTSSSDQVYFVSDGSITFNVTTTAP